VSKIPDGVSIADIVDFSTSSAIFALGVVNPVAGLVVGVGYGVYQISKSD